MAEKRLTSGIVTFSKEEYNDYQTHLSSRKEWPGINVGVAKDSRVTLNVPMLITELFRLVPYKEEDRYIHFHPFNMPHIKVRKIELVGVVTRIKRNDNNLFLTIEDGTGVIEVTHKLGQYLSLLKQRKNIDDKFRKQAENLKGNKLEVVEECPKRFPKECPRFPYPQGTCLREMAVLENKWWLETNSGLLGKEIQLFDYVYVIGYPCIDVKFQKIPQEITAEFIQHTKLTVFALSVTCISEETYNEKLSMWMTTTICRRYKEEENKTCTGKNK